MGAWSPIDRGLAAAAIAAVALMVPSLASAQAAGGSKPEKPTHATWTDGLALEPHGPYDRVYLPQNEPAEEDARGFPKDWPMAYGNAQHNAAFPAGKDAPQWVRDGVGWKYAEARAWPLENDKAFGDAVYGAKEALPVQTQFFGNALGVSVADGVVYGESDDMFAYAVNARTGQLIWRFSPVQNNLMGNPLVVGDTVYLSAGSVSFNFAHVVQYAKTGKTSRGEDESVNGVIALDRRTGAFKWMFMTLGEAMATPAYADGILYEATGSGNIYAIEAKSGKMVWKNHVGGIDNMSNPIVADGKVYVAMSVVPYLYCLDAKTGAVIWKETIDNASNTGMGDVGPAISDGIVVQDTIVDETVENGIKMADTTVQAMDAISGAILWSEKMGRGRLPPAFKGGMPLIHDGVVYVGTPVNSIYQALDLKTGKVLWTWHVPDAGPAGAGRGAPTLYKGVLYVSTGPTVYALDTGTGHEIGNKRVGGRFGIVNPVIVGGTIYLANSWDWLIAVPVREVNPQYND